MEIWASIIGVVLGILLGLLGAYLRNKYVVRTQPLIAMRSQGNTWNLRNRSPNRLLVTHAQYSGENDSWHTARKSDYTAPLYQGHEQSLGAVPDGVLVYVYWSEFPMFSRQIKPRSGSFFTKPDAAEAVVTPREMSPHGGK